MRIISGFAKGRQLISPPANNRTIRPTSDRAREALFSILDHLVKGSKVLDLFSGTGALGLEAFSRGAHFVVLVDHSNLALGVIKKNSLQCLQGYQGKAEIRVVKHDLRTPLPMAKLPLETHRGFDLIFADPPYAKDFSMAILNFFGNGELLKPTGLLILEERHDVLLPKKHNSLQCVDRRQYGDTAFYFFQPSV